ncbi:type II CAAX endopeptidase family protein [Gryllotalpicola daejeonensis]|uniref:Type II CAAX endopeptidase family protein n=2 Tax=Gryllotalpicola daejeonensis TaxID=993087 RepID=A0ABP7ZM71_9MICO
MERTGVWALCGVVILLALDTIGGAFASAQHDVSLWPAVLGLVGVVAAVGVGLWLYIAVIMRRWARREPVELTGAGKARNALAGLVIGCLFMAVAFPIVLALGGYRVDGFAHFGAHQVLNVVSMVLVSAFLEELMFRGILLQAIEKWLGWIPALAITSLLFGAVHLLNDLSASTVSVWSALDIAIEAGFFLGAAFLWRRNLWLVIGIHAGWNATESLLGIPVSGTRPDGVLQISAHGSSLLNGGAFGIEGSLVTLLLGAALGVLFLVLPKQGKIASKEARA